MSPGHIASATLPAGFVAPCLPTKTHTLPFGAAWIQVCDDEIVDRSRSCVPRIGRLA